jgi:hypothetical protein
MVRCSSKLSRGGALSGNVHGILREASRGAIVFPGSVVARDLGWGTGRAEPVGAWCAGRNTVWAGWQDVLLFILMMASVGTEPALGYASPIAVRLSRVVLAGLHCPPRIIGEASRYKPLAVLRCVRRRLPSSTDVLGNHSYLRHFVRRTARAARLGSGLWSRSKPEDALFAPGGVGVRVHLCCSRCHCDDV